MRAKAAISATKVAVQLSKGRIKRGVWDEPEEDDTVHPL